MEAIFLSLRTGGNCFCFIILGKGSWSIIIVFTRERSYCYYLLNFIIIRCISELLLLLLQFSIQDFIYFSQSDILLIIYIFL